MVTSIIFFLIVAYALPSIYKIFIIFLRMINMVLTYTGVVLFTALYIQSIGSGVSIHKGSFQIITIIILAIIFILVWSFIQLPNAKFGICLFFIFISLILPFFYVGDVAFMFTSSDLSQLSILPFLSSRSFILKVAKFFLVLGTKFNKSIIKFISRVGLDNDFLRLEYTKVVAIGVTKVGFRVLILNKRLRLQPIFTRSNYCMGLY
jgi:hypothetical protein